jgi:hypothetical protein
MSKTRRKTKTRELGRKVTTMKVVTNPVHGRFYAIDYDWYDDEGIYTISLYSGKRELIENEDDSIWLGEPDVLDELTPGSMIYYLGEEQLPNFHGIFYKVGYKDFFGFIRSNRIVFYDLGDLSSL